MENFYTSIGMPTSLKELDLEVSDAQIDELAYKCSFEGKRTIGAFQVLQQEDMKNIFRLARG
ncbi:MAG: NADH-dependent alcohol dehydrogenase, partial [Anaeromusa sp.]|nr:NADH-dependent alcohol dehydrogenase [Anaeromusa sp.]